MAVLRLFLLETAEAFKRQNPGEGKNVAREILSITTFLLRK
jgi:hypothetical protein